MKKIKTFRGLTVLPRPQLPFYESLACLFFVSQKTDAPIFLLYYPLWAVRNSFPSENQEYFPFIQSNDDEDHTCQQKANNNYCQFYNREITTIVNFITVTCFTIRNSSSYWKLWKKNTCEGVLFLVKLQASAL